jgi:hypothetical protein
MPPVHDAGSYDTPAQHFPALISPSKNSCHELRIQRLERRLINNVRLQCLINNARAGYCIATSRVSVVQIAGCVAKDGLQPVCSVSHAAGRFVSTLQDTIVRACEPDAWTLISADPMNEPAARIDPQPPAESLARPIDRAAEQAAAALSASATPLMDREFIARNQIVERYLAGKLPIKGATDFERFCREEPELLDEIGLPERVNAGLRLLEASGKPEPWQQAPKKPWEKPQLLIGLGAAVVLLALTLAIVGSSSADKSRSIAKLKASIAEQPLEPASATRTIQLVPSRSGSSNTPAITIGGEPAELDELHIDMTHSPYRSFRVTIDRVDQGRVAILHNILKDSNGQLHLALNSSALGPGNYEFTIDGLTWRGDPEPDAWITIRVQR